MTEDFENETGLREVPASEILAKIQKGEPVEYEDVIVKDYLDISKLNLPKDGNKFRISSRIAITNSRILDLVEFKNTVFQENVDFFGTKFGGDNEFFGSASFFNSQFDGLASFGFAKFEDAVNFRGSKFKWGADFTYCEFKGPVDFCGSQFDANVTFISSRFFPDADFSDSRFKSAFFGGCNFNGVNFEKAVFVDDVDFKGSEFSRGTDFRRVQFNGKVDLNDSTLIGNVLTFEDAKFNEPRSQENACRIAKNVLAKAGNRDEEEYHFYREMEAKRIQKGIRGNSGLGLGYLLLKTDTWSFRKFFFHDALEFLFVQKIFGYGIHPYWLFGWWLGFVASFVIIYWIGGAVGIPGIDGTINQSSNLADYVWFSIATAATPGYALYKPLGDFKIVAGIEAILGTFMWAAFITTFVRKFSR